MASSLLGFRHPQFSEDAEWLPAWLQPPLTNNDMKGQFPSLQGFKNIGTNEYVNPSSMDDDRYKSCRLFLSGEDVSQMTFSPSMNGIHFNLHLSLIGSSENAASLDRSQLNGLYSDHAPAVQKLETSIIEEAKPQCLKAANNAGDDNLFPISQKENSKIMDPQSLLDSKGMKPEDSVRSLKVADINDAIELSIAASETLLIHELIKSELTTQQHPASSALEAALKVKQARLDGFRDTISHSIEEVTEMDLLSDLDESTMVDAYEDVGLSVTGNGDLSFSGSVLSHVKDTFASENYTSCEEQICRQPGVSEVYCSETPLKAQLKYDDNVGKVLDSNADLDSDNDDRKKYIDDAMLGYETANLACDVDPSLQWSVEVPDTSFSTEKVEIAMGDLTSFQATASSSSQARNSDFAVPTGKDGNIKIVVPKFQSRWFGGWTRKEEVNDSTPPDHRTLGNIPQFLGGETSFLSESADVTPDGKELNAYTPPDHRASRNIPQLFGGETSFLSESADVAPDENSFVQTKNKRPDIGSQSTVERFRTDDSQGILLSKDVVMISHSPSFVDPLCSAVPCTFSSENASSPFRLQSQKDQVGSTNPFSPTLEAGMDDGERTIHQSTELDHGEELAVPVINGYTPGICMESSKSSSLRTEFGHIVRQNAPLANVPSGSDPIAQRRVTKLRNYSMLCPSLSAHPKTNITGRDQTSPIICNLRFLSVRQAPTIDMANKSKNCDETAKADAELPIHVQMEKSKCFPQDVGGEEYPEQTLVGKHSVEKSKGFQKAQTDCIIPSPALVPRRKRVRFSEAEINLELIKKTQMQQTTNKDCPVTRRSKRLKCHYRQPETRAQEAKKSSRRRDVVDQKRLIFQNIDFLLTGFSVSKKKEIESLIMKYGGKVLSEIPSPISRGKRSSRFKSQSPVVLCIRKLQTTKFLYGCAVNACILKVDWLADSIAVGSALPPKKYMILPTHAGSKCTEIGKRVLSNNFIFLRVGIMLHGKHKFCTKVTEVVKHGGGMIFKTLHWLVQNLETDKISAGVIVTEDENGVSRHLKKCASEQKIPVMPFRWIIDSLYLGRLLPFPEKDHSSISQLVHMVALDSFELSEEI